MKPVFWAILFFLSAAIQSCSSSEEPLTGNAEISADKRVVRHKGIYPDTIAADQILANYPKSSWKDLDHYYKVTIPRYHSNTDYEENLKKHVIFLLTFPDFRFFESADQATLAFYVREMQQFSFSDTDILIKYLKALENTWSKEQIRRAALGAYEKTIQYYRDQMPEGALAEEQSRFDRLKAYAESMASK